MREFKHAAAASLCHQLHSLTFSESCMRARAHTHAHTVTSRVRSAHTVKRIHTNAHLCMGGVVLFCQFECGDADLSLYMNIHEPALCVCVLLLFFFADKDKEEEPTTITLTHTCASLHTPTEGQHTSHQICLLPLLSVSKQVLK